MKIDFFVVAPQGNKYRQPAAMLKAVGEIENSGYGTVTWQEPDTGPTLVESDKPWRIRVHDDFAATFRNMFTAKYGLQIVEEKKVG